EPVLTRSWHRLQPGLHEAVADYLQRDREGVREYQQDAMAYLPYRRAEQGSAAGISLSVVACNPLYTVDGDRVDRHVAVPCLPAGGYLADGLDHVLAADHLAEHGVAEVTGAVVEEVVVGQVDEELTGGAVAHLGAGHGNGVAIILQAVIGF